MSWNKKTKIGGWWEYYLSPFWTHETKRRVMRVLPLTLLKHETKNRVMRVLPLTQMKHETNMNHGKQQTFDAWWKYWTKNMPFFHGICRVFCTFFIFLIFMGFLPSWFFAGGGRACNKIEIWEMNFGDESITSFLFFFKHDITVTANKHHSKGSTPNCR